MTKPSIILAFLFILLAVTARPDNAPVTTAGAITNATTNGSVTVPVTVTNFVSIGYFTLTLRYRSNLATYVGATPNPAFPGMTVTQSISNNIGKLVIVWPQTPGGVTLPDGAHLLDLTFTYLSGTTTLAWGYASPLVCEYKKYSGGSYFPLTDTLKEYYYINGGISNRSAPVTTAPTIANPTPGGPVVAPITATGFTRIGSFYLQLEYDSTVLTCTSVVPYSSFLGAFSYGLSAGTGSNKVITVGWYGNSVTITGVATIFTANFTYHNTAGKANNTTLRFIDNGPSSEYADSNGYVLIDFPYATYYKTGLVYSQYAAKTWLPVVTTAAPNSAISLPVKTRSFTNIRSFNLTFDYDTTVISYGSFTANAAFSGALTVTKTSSSGARKKLVINWPGPGPLTLADSSTLVTLNTTYLAGTTTLAWVRGDATSCRFNDAVGNAFYDQPKTTYYQDGLLASQVAPLTIATSVSPSVGQFVTIPVLVNQFTGIGSWSLSLDYNPGVLNHVSWALVPALGGTFIADTAGAGRINMSWTGTAATLADSATLINLTFKYLGGETALVWYDNGSSCRYAASASSPDLYDKPKNQFYINGYAGPNAVTASFTAANQLPAVNQAVTFTDLSTGSPTAWQWIVSPPDVIYVNGTSATSQNPQMKFTSNGVFTITEVVTKGFATGVKARSAYIHAGTPGLWTGITSADWNTASNWHNYLVPGSTAGLVIPTTAPFWPDMTGDLTLGGIQGLNLTIQGNAQMTIGGNLTINNGSSLTFTGAGTLFLGGSWSNIGSFTCGTGTVEFSGTTDATIYNTGITQTFYKIVVDDGKAVLVGGSVVVSGQ